MSTTPKRPLDSFEEKLLGELRTVVAERPAASVDRVPDAARPLLLRRPVRLVAAAALVAAGGIGASLWAGEGGGAAYALGTDSNGDITVTINKPEGAEALEKALAEKGIKADVTFLPSGQSCKEGRFTPAETGQGTLALRSVAGTDARPVMTISKGMIGTGQTFVLETSGPDASTLSIGGGVAQGEVKPCVPVTSIDIPRPALTASGVPVPVRPVVPNDSIVPEPAK